MRDIVGRSLPALGRLRRMTAIRFVCENSKYFRFEENVGMRWLSRLLKEVARGRWWISRDRCDDGAMASFLSTATFSCLNIEHTGDAGKALVYENYEVPAGIFTPPS